MIWLVSPAWGRYDVTRLALAERRWACDVLASRGLTANSVIIADDDNLDIAREYGFDVIEMGNDDLGAKFNAGYAHAGRQGGDIFVHIGSDDWVHPDVFNILLEQNLAHYEPDFESGGDMVWSDGPAIAYQRRLMVVDLPRWQGVRCDARGQWGCIPWLIPRSVMEGVRFSPIKRGLMRGIDGSLALAVNRQSINWIPQDAPAEWIVDWKTETNVTPYAGLRHALAYEEERRPGSLLEKYYPPHLVKMARATAR